MKKITIIGAGAFGRALGGVLEEKGNNINYYDPRMGDMSLADALTGAEVMVLCVPSAVAPEVLAELPADVPLIVATKGLLSDAELLRFKKWAVLSGPGFAQDIKEKKVTHLTTSDWKVDKLFTTDYLDFDTTNDKKGILMCGALKNVYAILAGVLGLKPVSREHRQFLTAAAEEMAKILEANGADPATVELHCGKDDLKLTCGEPSRNYEFGVRVRTEGLTTPDKTVEGVATLKRIRQGEIVLPEGLELMQQVLQKSEEWG